MLNRHLLNAFLMLGFVAAIGCESTSPSNSRYRKPIDPYAAKYPKYAAPVHHEVATVSTTNGATAPSSGTHAARLPYASPITIEKSVPTEVGVGSDFEYRLVVTNTTNTAFRDVVVTEELSPNFALTATGPKPTQFNGTSATWRLSRLAPQQSQVIRIVGKAKAAGALQGCSSVTFTPHVCTTIQATQANLQLVKSVPAEVGICEQIPVRFTVTNAGSGVARNVVVQDEGLRNAQGLPLTLTVGDVPAGQSRTVAARLRPARVGRFESKAIATAAGGLRAEASAATRVTQPVLALTQDGPNRLLLGRDATFNITVTNKADCTARDTVVEQHLSPGTTVRGVSAGGQVQGNRVVWNLGTLNANQSRRVAVTVQQTIAGAFSSVATAKSRCAQQVSSASRATVKGIPAILLEVIDASDPIAVGEDVTYVIKVTNQGSAPGTNIVVKCDLENTMQFMGSDGATRATAVGQTITFAPRGRLAPKAVATWNVRIKALKAADARFNASMTSDQISRPVIENEATNFYE